MYDTMSGLSDAKRPQPVGPLAAAVIIVLILAIGGAYFFITQEQHIRAQRLEQQQEAQVNS